MIVSVLLSIVYNYDSSGNILSKDSYSYQTGNGTLTGEKTTKAYTYGDSNWGDKLTAYNGESIVYDAVGNPTTYRGKTLEWSRGRMLKKYVQSPGMSYYDFKYNDAGIRTRKTNTVTNISTYDTEYILNGDRVVKDVYKITNTSGHQLSREDKIYQYDSTGNVSAFKYQKYDYYGEITTDKWFFYKKNLQGDIVGILDENGNQVVTYTYDSWGKLLSTVDNSGINLGSRNEYLYRGYRYDRDLGLYYLQSRYYDPETGRFINADDTAFIGASGTALSGNLFAYCENDIVNYYDEDGYKKKSNKKNQKRENPNKRHGADKRKPTGQRERNVGHDNAEEHSRVSKGTGGDRVRRIDWGTVAVVGGSVLLIAGAILFAPSTGGASLGLVFI